MISFVAKDDDFFNHLRENKHSSLFDYIAFQEKNSHFGAEFWTNPFNVTPMYQECISSLKEINEKQELIKAELVKLKEELEKLNELSINDRSDKEFRYDVLKK